MYNRTALLLFVLLEPNRPVSIDVNRGGSVKIGFKTLILAPRVYIPLSPDPSPLISLSIRSFIRTLFAHRPSAVTSLVHHCLIASQRP